MDNNGEIDVEQAVDDGPGMDNNNDNNNNNNDNNDNNDDIIPDQGPVYAGPYINSEEEPNVNAEIPSGIDNNSNIEGNEENIQEEIADGDELYPVLQ
ncbi:unnamed protein product [Caenorhabditis brenneri]